MLDHPSDAPRVDPAWPNGSDIGGSPPVFLHSSFRTGSTWLWQKLRGAPTTLAFYEIFHETLATLSVNDTRTLNATRWNSRHPAGCPYFLEFMPLLEPRGGVAGFDASMSYDSFIPDGGPDGELRSIEKAYVDRLVATAWSKKRIPVLSCTRSLGRARALKRAVPGRTIVLHRNLFHQWSSYCSQAEAGNPFFLETVHRTISAATHDPFMRHVSDWFDCNGQPLAQEDLFQVFVVLHLYLHAIAFDAADLVVDLTEIATDSLVRRGVEANLTEMLRHEIDLSDVRHDCEFADFSVDDPGKVRDTVTQFAKLIPGALLSARAGVFVERAKDTFLAEWDRFEFYTRRPRSVLTARLTQANQHVQELAARCQVLEAETGRLTCAATQAAAERDDLIRRASDEADGLREQVAAAARTQLEFARVVAGLAAERDGFGGGLQAAVDEKEAPTPGAGPRAAASSD